MLNGLKAFDWLRTYTERQVYPMHFIRQIFFANKMLFFYENFPSFFEFMLTKCMGYFNEARGVYNKVGFEARYLWIFTRVLSDD